MDLRGAVVLDTSVVIEGVMSGLLEGGQLQPGAIIVPTAVVDELEHQANQGHETGFLGLDELKRLRAVCTERDTPFLIKGTKPTADDIARAGSGAIDDLIRRTAQDEGAVLITADKVQATVAEATGIPVHFIKLDAAATDSTPLDRFFVEGAMSVHLKEDARSIRKVGKPGEWRFEEIEQRLDRNAMQEIAKALVEQAGARKDSYIETERRGSTILQLGRYRTVIAKPPFASGWEITAVRPVKQLTIDEYNMSDKLRTRLAKRAEGILIAGAPGSGKSTFVQALAAFYNDQNKIVKTLEAPRDLIVPKEVTQYSLSHATPEEVRDVLLLNRPDYTIFDEMRNTDHFTLYTDLRLAGVGMVGIVHATKPIDAIQRFMSRIDLGVIPHVVDTVIFIQAGEPKKVFAVDIQVKVPSGMTEEDLARPIVCISDFETDKLEYEVYTFGEQTMVIPVTEQAEKKAGVLKLVAEAVKEYFYQYTEKPSVEMMSAHKAVVTVPKSAMAPIIGTGGSNIKAIEKELGISIDLREGTGKDSRDDDYSRGKGGKKDKRGWKGKGDGHDSVATPKPHPDLLDENEEDENEQDSLTYDLDIGKREIIIELGKRYANMTVQFRDGRRAICTRRADKAGNVSLDKNTPDAIAVAYAVKHDAFDVRIA